MREITLTESERTDTDREYGQHLHHREHRRGAARRCDGRAVKERDEPQCRQSHHCESGKRNAVSERQCQPRLIEHSTERRVHEDGKAHGERRLRTGLHDRKDGPTIEEARRLTVGASQKDVVTTRCWHHRSKLGVAERTEQRQQTRGQPHGHDDHRIVDVTSHDTRLQKDASADDVSYVDGDARPQSQTAIEPGHERLKP